MGQHNSTGFKISNSWVFNSRRDLFITLAIFGIGYFLTTLSDIRIGILEIAILPVLFDQNHVLITYVRVYLDSNEFNSRKALYIGIPIFSLTAAVLLGLTSPDLFVIVYGHLSLFHFIRQQYGWLMITTKKNQPRLGSYELLCNKLFFYNLTVTPLLFYFASEKYDFVWIGPMLTLPSYLEPLILKTFWLILLATCLYEVFKAVKTRILNLAKYNQYFVAFVSWFAVHYVFNSMGLTYSILIVSHGLSYWYISYFIMSKKWDERGGHPLFSYWYSAPFLFLTLCLVAFFYWNISGLNGPLAKHFIGDQWRYMMIIPATISWTHYLLDGFIWTSSKNKSVRSYITLEPVAETQKS